ncbi:MAG: hypothetical protein M1269_07135 [Chloroflexi bacterium]|nr:hypothetical protein [Chloroflexota bacterium]
MIKKLLPVIFIAFILSSCRSFTAAPMTGADKFFRGQKTWLGADGSNSVTLAGNRTLWLYGDTFIDESGGGSRKGAAFINNSIAIQQGKSFTPETFKFYWGKNDEGRPASFFQPGGKKGWLWPLSGIRADNGLYLFFLEVESTGEKDTALGFRTTGNILIKIENPDDPPGRWRMTRTQIPGARFTGKENLFFGSAVIQQDNSPAGKEAFLYVLGCLERLEPELTRYMVAARARRDRVSDFGDWEFYSGSKDKVDNDRDFLSGDRWRFDSGHITGLLSGIPAEYSICYLPAARKYALIYSGDLTDMKETSSYGNRLPGDVMARYSVGPAGPWSMPVRVYECPETWWKPTYICYAAKAHPGISGDDELIISYASNSLVPQEALDDMRIYWPSFIKVKPGVKE